MNWHLDKFLKDFKVASLAATRLPNVERILNKICFKNLKVFVELGPGDGAFTAEIMRRLPKNSKLLLIESNADFVSLLKAQFRDPRVEVVHACATDLPEILLKKGVHEADCILCGIPLTFFNSQKLGSFIASCSKSLKIDGSFIVYQALNPVHKSGLISLLKLHFKQIKDELLTINLPPLFVLYADRRIPHRDYNSYDSQIESPFSHDRNARI